MNLVWERLLPAFQPAALPPDAAAGRKLTDKLAVLKLKAPSGTATTAAARTSHGKRFVFDSNKLGLESLTVQSTNAGGDAVLALRLAGADQKLAAGYQRWAKGALQLTAAGAPEPVAASGAWTADDTYTMTVARYRTPFTTLYQLRFAGDQLFLKIEQNVGAAETRVTELTGQIQGKRQKAEGRN